MVIISSPERASSEIRISSMKPRKDGFSWRPPINQIVDLGKGPVTPEAVCPSIGEPLDQNWKVYIPSP